jgi:glycosyltransferase involved in cell wall biosynthesis
MRIAIITNDHREPLQAVSGNETKSQPLIGPAVESLLQGLAVSPEVEVHVVSCLKAPLPSPEKIAPNIFYHGLAVPQSGWMRTLYQGCVRKIHRKLWEIQPDIVHGQGTERYCAMSAMFSGFPNVITIHGNMRIIARVNQVRMFSHSWLAARLEGFTLPRVGGVICITGYTRNAVKSLARRTWVVPNAVDASFFDVQPSPATNVPPAGLCVGTLCFRKNQIAFIRALDPLAKERPFKIVFASEPPQDDYGRECLQLIRERPWCEHAGFLNRPQLRAMLATASFVALPTREDNCPMVVLEGMAAGVPVLASKVGGVPDLIEPDQTGLFFDPERPESFREGVGRIITDRAWAQQLAANAKAEALRRFHPRVIAQSHLDIYREVLGK